MLSREGSSIIPLEREIPKAARAISIASATPTMAALSTNMLQNDRRERPAQTPRVIGVLLDEAIGGFVGPQVRPEQREDLVRDGRAREHQALPAARVRVHPVDAWRLWQRAVRPGSEE